MRKEKIVTIPNLITLTRLILLPFFVFFFIKGRMNDAVMVFVVIALSDLLDGVSARITKQKTRFGALFDTTMDGLVIFFPIVLSMFMKKYFPIGIMIIILAPLIVSSIAKAIYLKKTKKGASTIAGKISFALAYITVAVFLIDFAYKNVFLILTLIIAYISAINYIIKDVKLFIG